MPPPPRRRHARKASATTAEEILLPQELMAGLTATLSPPSMVPATADTNPSADASAAAPEGAGCGSSDAPPVAAEGPLPGLELAPLFPADGADIPAEPSPLPSTAGADTGSDTPALPARPEKGILKEPRPDDGGGSRWSLWPGAKRWISEALLSTGRTSLAAQPTFAQGAGIPAAAAASSDETAEPYRTAPSLDFERSTSLVPPLSQERIKATEFWSTFAQELDPSRLKRIRFSMPLIVTEFDPDTSRPVTSVETSSAVLRTAPPAEGRDAESAVIHNEYFGGAAAPSTEATSGDGADAADDDSTEAAPDTSTDVTPDTSTDVTPDTSTEAALDTIMEASADADESETSARQSRSNSASSDEQPVSAAVDPLQPLQWDVRALAQRRYCVQEVRELYERTCRSLGIEPLGPFEETLLKHVHSGQALASLALTGGELHGAHMRCFAEMLDLDFGLVRLDLSHCSIDDGAARALAYSLLCNDSVRYLSLAHNARLRSDGVRCVATLVRHSKQLRVLDISGIAIRKKSAGYLAAALAGLGASWALGRGSMRMRDPACETIGLETLHMNACSIDPAALAILASGVRLSPLQHLSLRLNALGAAAGPILREMLYGDPPESCEATPHPPRPISVSLHGLSGAQSHLGAAPRVSLLRSLDLSQNDLGRATLDLAEGLLWNTSLRCLKLRQNKLQPAGFAPFVECLGTNATLAFLDLSRNPVCGPGTAALDVLATVAAQCQALRALLLAATGMTSEGAIMLAECLPDLHRLERLDVSENPAIDVAGLMALSASIKLSRSLVCVEISVDTGDDVCAALEQAIAQVCIANMQRLDAGAAADGLDAGDGFGPPPMRLRPRASAPPEADTLAGVSARASGDSDSFAFTSLAAEIATISHTHSSAAHAALPPTPVDDEPVAPPVLL
ncbi:hypothetical protein IWQ56_001565 [Coemansia nantahalensis]|nr:hypothetical protein IWQ56_001565 [Coemansia nantahalensis]